jgi:transcriptional regulator with XRE-family HTH domain
VTSFAEWIGTQRAMRNLSLAQLATISGIDASSISRIENERTQPTYASVVALCRAMDIGKEEFVHVFRHGIDPASLQQKTYGAGEAPVLAYDDVEAFGALFEADRIEAIFILADLLNELEQIRSYTVHNAIRADLSVHAHISHFDADDIENILASTSFRITPHHPVPPPHMVKWFYAHSGLLSGHDLAAYIRYKEDYAGIQLSRYVPLTLVESVERGSIDNIKFKDLLELDRLLADGEILAMSWYIIEMDLLHPNAAENPAQQAEVAYVKSLYSAFFRQLQFEAQAQVDAAGSTFQSPWSPLLKRFRDRIYGPDDSVS